MFFIKEAQSELPRERLLRKGVSALTNVELLAILLRTGTKEQSVIELSKYVLDRLEEHQQLDDYIIEELLLIKGIKLSKATTIVAAIELGKRLSKQMKQSPKRIKSSKDVYEILYSEVKNTKQEHFYCLYLNTKSQIIKQELIFIGTINQTLVHPREIFKNAVKLLAASVIFIHNHPTGDPTPSDADIKITKILVEAGILLGIQVIDHMIIGDHSFYSFKESKTYKML